jgi:hypothetical protein
MMLAIDAGHLRAKTDVIGTSCCYQVKLRRRAIGTTIPAKLSQVVV